MNKKIIAYNTIRSAHLEEVDKFVNEAIGKGWQPYGSLNSVLVHVDSTGSFHREGEPRIMYIQPIVRYEQEG
jgi:hypothetical protein